MSNWKSSNEYKRIQEILEDYWLNQPDEKRVTVCMTFEHFDGSVQSKRIVWTNPAFKVKRTLTLQPFTMTRETMQPTCMRTR